MTTTDCRDVLNRLGAYVDGELSGRDRLVVSRHIAQCGSCENEADALRQIGSALRSEAPVVDSSEVRGLAAGVVSRVAAEQEQSWRTRLQTGFEDWHWLMIGTGSVLGTTACTLLVASVLLFGPTPERTDSLAARLNSSDASAGTLFVVASPAGDEKSSMLMQFEGAGGPGGEVGPTIVPSSLGMPDESAMASALGEMMTRGGRLIDLSALSSADRLRAEALLDQIHNLRSADQRYNAGGQVTVKNLWLVAQASVSAKGL